MTDKTNIFEFYSGNKQGEQSHSNFDEVQTDGNEESQESTNEGLTYYLGDDEQYGLLLHLPKGEIILIPYAYMTKAICSASCEQIILRFSNEVALIAGKNLHFLMNDLQEKLIVAMRYLHKEEKELPEGNPVIYDIKLESIDGAIEELKK